MATYSELMKLTLPDRTDKYKIEDFNQNFTKIDSTITEAAAATATLVTAEKTARNAAISAEMLKLRKRNDMGIVSRFNSERHAMRQHHGHPYGSYIDGFINISGLEGTIIGTTLTNDGLHINLASQSKQFFTINKSFPFYFCRLNAVVMLQIQANHSFELALSFNNGQSWVTPTMISNMNHPFLSDSVHNIRMYQVNSVPRSNSVKAKMTFSSTVPNGYILIGGLGLYPDEIE